MQNIIEQLTTAATKAVSAVDTPPTSRSTSPRWVQFDFAGEDRRAEDRAGNRRQHQQPSAQRSRQDNGRRAEADFSPANSDRLINRSWRGRPWQGPRRDCIDDQQHRQELYRQQNCGQEQYNSRPAQGHYQQSYAGQRHRCGQCGMSYEFDKQHFCRAISSRCFNCFWSVIGKRCVMPHQSQIFNNLFGEHTTEMTISSV